MSRLQVFSISAFLIFLSCLGHGQHTPSDSITWFRPDQEGRVANLPLLTVPSDWLLRGARHSAGDSSPRPSRVLWEELGARRRRGAVRVPVTEGTKSPVAGTPSSKRRRPPHRPDCGVCSPNLYQLWPDRRRSAGPTRSPHRVEIAPVRAVRSDLRRNSLFQRNAAIFDP